MKQKQTGKAPLSTDPRVAAAAATAAAVVSDRNEDFLKLPAGTFENPVKAHLISADALAPLFSMFSASRDNIKKTLSPRESSAYEDDDDFEPFSASPKSAAAQNLDKEEPVSARSAYDLQLERSIELRMDKVKELQTVLESKKNELAKMHKKQA